MTDLPMLQEQLAHRSALDRVRCILSYAQYNDMKVVQTTSFGIQSAMMIELLAMAGGIQDVPIVFIDTGYLPKETYQFAEDIKSRYHLNLHIHQSDISPARMEAMYGKLWEQQESDESHRQYNRMRKVVPMEAALQDLNADIVLTGLRSSQTKHRQNLSFANADGTRIKVCPLLDWDDDAVEAFFECRNLPYHPLFHEGYRTVGDWHSSAPFDPNIHLSVRDTRFHGRAQECGLHISISNLSLADTSTSITEASSSMASSESSASFESTVGGSEDPESGFVIFGRPNCKFCRAAKQLLGEVTRKFDPPDRSIRQVIVGKDISKEALIRKLGRQVTTVPQVLYNGHHIGGYDNLCQWGQTKFETSEFRSLVDSITIE